MPIFLILGLHSTVVCVYGYYITLDGVNIVLELATGSLASLIFNHQPAVQINNILLQITTALKYMHSQNIAHRDLKPANVLYFDNGSIRLFKLTDFGGAKSLDNTATHTYAGTHAYIRAHFTHF